MLPILHSFFASCVGSANYTIKHHFWLFSQPALPVPTREVPDSTASSCTAHTGHDIFAAHPSSRVGSTKHSLLTIAGQLSTQQPLTTQLGRLGSLQITTTWTCLGPHILLKLLP